MLVNRPPDIPSAEITDESLFWNRRDFLKAAGLGAAAAGGLLPTRGRGLFRSEEEKLTPWEDVTGYNNYYEFGTGKDDPARNATRLRTRPWKVEVAGEVKRPAVYDFDELLKPFTPAERVYRMRCVEGWSMVVPWLGIPLGAVIDRLEPTSKAKYVEFTTLLDPQQMPGQHRRVLDWPYVEGLRMDEARHPLANTPGSWSGSPPSSASFRLRSLPPVGGCGDWVGSGGSGCTGWCTWRRLPACSTTSGWSRDVRAPLTYGVVLLVLLGSRVWLARDRSRARRSQPAKTTEAKPAAAQSS